MQTFEFSEVSEAANFPPLVKPVPQPNQEMLTDNELIAHWAWEFRGRYKNGRRKKNPNYWNGPQVPKGQTLP